MILTWSGFSRLQIYGFKPEPYDSLQELLNDNELQEAPRFLAFTPGLTVGVSCEGQTAADRENILDDGVQFFPNNTDSINGYAGFPVVCVFVLSFSNSEYLLFRFTLDESISRRKLRNFWQPKKFYKIVSMYMYSPRDVYQTF